MGANIPGNPVYQNAVVNGDLIMKRSHRSIACACLTVLVLCIVLAPFVSAQPATASPSSTVPPILQACSQARNPTAGFICGFPGNESALAPEGPPYTIKCFDNSSTEFNQSVVSWKWNFGDGGGSTDQNPLHTYSSPSSYDIQLTVTTFCGSQYTNTTVDTISIYCSAPEPGFTSNVTEGYAPLAVRITDTSQRTPEDITRWTYWFDNTHSSNERNPVFTYDTPGTYTINQTVWKDCVQLGSSFYSPAVREIRVKSPLMESGVNGTEVTPVSGVTVSPAAPAGPSDIPGTLATTEPVPTGTGASTGTLSVDTQPTGAQVFIDEALRGTTPADLPDLSPGSHTLRFEREGYQSMTLQVTITEGQTTVLSTTLIPASGGIALLPVIVLLLIIIGILVGAVFLYKRQKAMNDED